MARNKTIMARFAPLIYCGVIDGNPNAMRFDHFDRPGSLGGCLHMAKIVALLLHGVKINVFTIGKI